MTSSRLARRSWERPTASLLLRTMLRDSPLALWPMDDGPGATSARDASGNGNTLTLIGSPNMEAAGPAPGMRAIGFNGTSQAASRALDLSGTSAITFTSLVWWNGFANDDQMLAEFTANYNSSTGGFIIDPNSGNPSGILQAALKGDSGYSSGEVTRPDAKVWQQWTWVLDKAAAGGAEVTPYRNGVPLSFTTVGGASNNTNAFANSTLYLMGRNGSSFFGTGRLAYTAVYPTALSATRISAHWAAFLRGR